LHVKGKKREKKKTVLVMNPPPMQMTNPALSMHEVMNARLREVMERTLLINPPSFRHQLPPY
jgi:hypothetical protein